jgi:hypothetical protein
MTSAQEALERLREGNRRITSNLAGSEALTIQKRGRERGKDCHEFRFILSRGKHVA